MEIRSFDNQHCVICGNEKLHIVQSGVDWLKTYAALFELTSLSTHLGEVQQIPTPIMFLDNLNHFCPTSMIITSLVLVIAGKKIYTVLFINKVWQMKHQMICMISNLNMFVYLVYFVNDKNILVSVFPVISPPPPPPPPSNKRPPTFEKNINKCPTLISARALIRWKRNLSIYNSS